MSEQVMRPLSDEQLDRHIRRFLEAQAEELTGVPSAREVALRLSDRLAAPRRLALPQLTWTPVQLLLLLALLMTLLLGAALVGSLLLQLRPADRPLGLVVPGDDGITIVSPSGATALTPAEGYELVNWAYPDQRGGLIFGQEAPPVPWPSGSVLWLRAGTSEPQVLVPETWVNPIGTATSGAGDALFLYVITEERDGGQLLSRLIAANLDQDGARREIAAWDEDGSFDGRYSVVAGGDAVALIDHQRMDDLGGSCAAAILLRAHDGTVVRSANDCLPGAWRHWVTALGLDGRTLAGWDADASRLVVVDLLTGATLHDRLVATPSSAYWARPMASPGGWSILLHQGPDALILDLAGRETMRLALPSAAGWWTIPYFTPIQLEPEARLGSGSGELPCQPSDVDLPRHELPDPVAATRQLILDLASSCDYRGLAALAREHGTVLSAGGMWGPPVEEGFPSDEQLIRAWIRDGVIGREPLARLAEVLTASPGYRREVSYPTGHDDPSRLVATDVWVWHGDAIEPGQYGRLIVSSDGRWRYYVQGE